MQTLKLLIIACSLVLLWISEGSSQIQESVGLVQSGVVAGDQVSGLD
jgi:hypothetical protein